MRVWWDSYGVGPWPVFSYDAANATVDGRPTDFRMRASLARSGRTSASRSSSRWMTVAVAKSLAEHRGADHIRHVLFDIAVSTTRLGAFGNWGFKHPARAVKGRIGDGPLLTMASFATEAELGFTLESPRAAGF